VSAQCFLLYLKAKERGRFVYNVLLRFIFTFVVFVQYAHPNALKQPHQDDHYCNGIRRKRGTALSVWK
jgi:hypothetical protein